MTGTMDPSGAWTGTNMDFKLILT